MRTSYRRCTAIAALIGSSAASAATYQGTITNVAHLDGKVFVLVQSGSFDGAASQCVGGNGMVYWGDPTPPLGRTLVAVALPAKLTGNPSTPSETVSAPPGPPWRPGTAWASREWS